MDFSGEQRHALGVALNEARLISAEVIVDRRAAALTFAVLSLPADDGPAPQDSRVLFMLHPVGRLVASLRAGHWSDDSAAVEEFAIGRLREVVLSFGGLPVYGWDFLDRGEEEDFASWRERPSVDWRSEPGGLSHTLDLFQEDRSRHLDLRIWFDELRIFTAERQEIPFDDFTAAGARWWEGFYEGDPRTAGHGIVPLAPERGDE